MSITNSATARRRHFVVVDRCLKRYITISLWSDTAILEYSDGPIDDRIS